MDEEHVPGTMDTKHSRTRDREIVNRWAVAEINGAVSDLLSGKGLLLPDADSCIGYFYVDHEEGILFRIHSLCRRRPDTLPEIIHHFKDHGEGLIIISDDVGSYTLLSGEDLQNLPIVEEQRWMLYYEPEMLHTLRKRVDIDRFRAPVYFDDVSVLLFTTDKVIQPELVWVRLNSQSEDGMSFQGTLLNEPYSNYGVHEGGMLTVRLDEQEGEWVMVAEIDFE